MAKTKKRKHKEVARGQEDDIEPEEINQGAVEESAERPEEVVPKPENEQTETTNEQHEEDHKKGSKKKRKRRRIGGEGETAERIGGGDQPPIQTEKAVSTRDTVVQKAKKRKKQGDKQEKPERKKKKKVKPVKATADTEVTRETSAVGDLSAPELKIKKKQMKGKKAKKERMNKVKKKPRSVKGQKSSGSLKGAKSQPSMQELRTKLSSYIELDQKTSKPELFQMISTESLSSEESGSEEGENLIKTEKSLVVSQVAETKKKKKKGAEKREKKRKLKLPEAEGRKEGEEIEPQDDILAEISRMKHLAELEASGEETGTETAETEMIPKRKQKKKKKKGPKKKLSKKEKQRLAAEAAEKARLQAEEEAAKAAELERIRLAEERKAAIAKEKRERIEQQIRVEQFDWMFDEFNKLVAYNKQLRADTKSQSEWEVYVNCGRLPNPGMCDQMNTFLHLWENVIQETSMEEAARRTRDVLELLNELDDLIDTAEEPSSSQVKNWKWVRLLFRKQQAKSLDVATYRLLRNIEKNLHRIDIPTADYKYQDENLALCLWLRIQLPTPLPNPRRPPKPRIEITFDEMKMEVQFPPSIDGEKVALRALYVKYDHLSDLSDTFQRPPTPQQYDIDLYTYMKQEWRAKLLYKYNNREREVFPASKEGEEAEPPPEEPEERVIGPDDEVPIVPYRKLEPSASGYIIINEDALYNETRVRLAKNVPEDVINLRRYIVIGGVYSLNLIHQPPQPQDFVTLDMSLTPLYLPKQLELVDLCLDYHPPKPPEPGVRRLPEEIEEEMKRQEEELEKLILITVTLPEHVIFLELPMVCYWDEERCVWTKSEVFDLKHNEEKGQTSFRARKCGTFALAVYRYANLPYQTWEMKPEVNGTVSLQITAAILMVEFNVRDGLIALAQLQNSPNNALQDVVGTYFPLPKLIRMLQGAGVDVFPAFDAFCYVENACEKHWPMEKHLYFNMAQLGLCFNFAWSRWNSAAGRRGAVLQMREYNVEKTKQKHHSMLHVTPSSAIFADCTEVSQSFNAEGVENMKFYPDLYHLMKGTSSMAIKNKVGQTSKELVFALYELLLATRVVAFS